MSEFDLNKSRSIIILGDQEKEGAIRLKSVQKATGLKQNQKFE